MAIWQWSKTATSNNTSDPTMNWSEGIPPSIVDDNVRALMARVAEWRDDISGSLTSAGTPPTYTLTTNEVLHTPTPTTGQLISFVPNTTNVGNDTIAIDLGSAYAIQTAPGVPVNANVLIAGTPYTMMFNGTAWILRNYYGLGGSSFVVPIGGMIDWAGGSAPNSNYALPFGQGLNTTTYATLFSIIGYTYGGGGATFNLPDVRGRVVAGLDNMGGSAAGRIGTLATDSGTIVGTSLGSNGGSQSHVQTQAELVSHGHTGSGNVSDPNHVHPEQVATGNTGGLVGPPAINTANGFGDSQANTDVATGGTGISVPSLNINATGSSAAMAWLQPTIMMSKIIRII